MKLTDAKTQFISSWGAIGTEWGIPRTMALIHGLLLVTAKALSTEDIMDQLGISRGNVNMNVRELIAWGLVEKKNLQGDRKEYFVAEKDFWKISIQVMRERRKRELDPVIKLANTLSNVEGREAREFNQFIAELKAFAEQADKAIELLIKTGDNGLLKAISKMLK